MKINAQIFKLLISRAVSKGVEVLRVATEGDVIRVRGRGPMTQLDQVASLEEAPESDVIWYFTASDLSRVGKALLKEGSVRFRVKEGQVHLTCGRSRFRITPLVESAATEDMGNSAREYAVSVEAKAFHGALERATPASDADNVRRYLNGVLMDLDFEGGCRLMLYASNGRRLHVHPVGEVDPALAVPREKLRVRSGILPFEGVKEISRLIKGISGELQITKYASNVCFEAADMRVNMRLIDATYPDFDRVLIQEDSVAQRVELPVADMLEGLSNVGVFSDDLRRQVELRYSAERKAVRLAASNSDQNGADAVISLEDMTVLPDEDFREFYRIEYLRDALKSCGDKTVRLGFQQTGSATGIWGEGGSAVLMPIIQ